MYACMHACMHVWMDGWMDGWMYERVCTTWLNIYTSARGQHHQLTRLLRCLTTNVSLMLRTSTMILARPKTNVFGQWWSTTHISPSSINKSQKQNNSTSLYPTCRLFCWICHIPGKQYNEFNAVISTWHQLDYPPGNQHIHIPPSGKAGKSSTQKSAITKTGYVRSIPGGYWQKHKMLHTEISNKTSCVIN